MQCRAVRESAVLCGKVQCGALQCYLFQLRIAPAPPLPRHTPCHLPRFILCFSLAIAVLRGALSCLHMPVPVPRPACLAAKATLAACGCTSGSSGGTTNKCLSCRWASSPWRRSTRTFRHGTARIGRPGSPVSACCWGIVLPAAFDPASRHLTATTDLLGKPLQAHPPSAAELASIEGQGQGLGLQDAYGAGEAGSSEDEAEADEEGGQDAAATAEAAEQQLATAAAAAAASSKKGGRNGNKRGGGGGPGKLHAAHFTAAEIERRRGLWEQRIQRPEMQVGGCGCLGVGGWSVRNCLWDA